MNETEERAGELGQATRERTRLVRLCARLTGAPEVAEDLAQETLLEAWRLDPTLSDPSGRGRWLAQIARYVCLRWTRQAARAAARCAPVEPGEQMADPFDITEGMERRELAALIGRGLACLPADTRALLVERYWHNLPYQIMAERRSVSEDAISMRLSRGKKQLRQLLETDLRAAAASYKPYGAGSDPWEATRLWCQQCGQHQLLAQLPHTAGIVAFRCPGCSPEPGKPGIVYSLTNRHFARLLGGYHRPKVILRHATAWVHTYFFQSLVQRSAPCTHCNRSVIPRLPHGVPFIQVSCEACGTVVSTSLQGLLLSLPEVYRFWATQHRIRIGGAHEIDIAGQPATVTRFESLTAPTQLEVITLHNPRLLDSYQVFEVKR